MEIWLLVTIGDMLQAFPIMIGELEPSGNLNANIIHQITQNIRGKFVSQVSIRMRLVFSF